MARRAFKESDVVRDDQGQFAEERGRGKGGGNASFLAKFSKKIGATDDKATAKAKVAEAAKTWSPGSPKKTGAFGGVRVAKKTAPSAATAPAKKTRVKVAGPATLPKRKAPAKKAAATATASTGPRNFELIDDAGAKAMQRKMLKKQPWTASEKAALKTYTGNDYVEINSMLRNTENSGNPATKAVIRQARKAMREIPQDIMAFRGMGSGTAFGFSRDKDISKAQLDGLVGKTYHDPGFTSTSVQEAGYGYGQRIRAHISVPAGTRGAYVEGITQNKSEREIVLDAGSHFNITGYKQDKDGNVVLYMEVVKQDA